MASKITDAQPADAIDALLMRWNPELAHMNQTAKDEGAAYPKRRFVHSKIIQYLEGRIFIALIGPRGVGKSVLLKQIHNSSQNSFYISLDSSGGLDLFNIANELLERGVRLLLLDEIHAYPNYGQQLKKIYDFVPNMKIVFTSSSAISLWGSSYDLSRRVRLVRVAPFSFREFLWFAHSQVFAPLRWKDITNRSRCREYYGRTMHAETRFKRYLCGGNYPFSAGELEPIPLFRNTLETILTKDLFFSARLSLEEIQDVRRMLEFIGRSQSEGISYSSISQNSGISKYKVQKYVDLMEKSFVLRRVMPKGTNVTKEPKILFALPYRLLYRQYDDCIGALREDFFVEAISSLGMGIDYLKGRMGEKTPDYVVDDFICEVGGHSKGFSQFKGFAAKKKIIFTQPGMLDEMRRPLFFAGMLE
ncbi:ATP-binding protein [Candidatus Micrarchaeota archaeon]|nr:ATP-binding protein [Candidatus Micrarchaeota archaeon]